VNTNLFEARVSTAGGGTIVGWRFKKFLDMAQRPLEILPDTTVGNLGIQFDPVVNSMQAVFSVVGDSQWVDQGVAQRKIRFSRIFPGFGRLDKELVFADNAYTIRLKVVLSFPAQTAVRNTYLIQCSDGILPTEENIKEDNSYSSAIAFQSGEKLEEKSGNTGLREGSTQWVAVRTKYFISALIPKGFAGKGAELKTIKTHIQTVSASAPWKRFSVFLSVPLETGKSAEQEFTLYIGPMDYHLLKVHGVQLEKVMNFGWVLTRPFSIAFLYTLEFLFRVVRNYGWAIILFSILIKIALYPLTKKSYDSMKQMQELQPKLKALQEKYKGEPQKLNAETMKMYKAHGVNPMSGCLPLILQMPILIALFNMFRSTIMFRQAGFMGIIKDLSGPDRIIPLGEAGAINVLPILMGVTMFIQQKKTMTDPKQKFMSYFMSFFMIYLFYNWSSGLNLYYLMFNVLQITQDLLLKRKSAAQAASA
jgi:YidC/Oxa1 family membrane protein insertase